MRTRVMIRWICICLTVLMASPSSAQQQDFLTAARAAYDAAWAVTPLSIHNAVIVSREAGLIGDVAERPDNRFGPDDTIIVYAEPRGYGYRDSDGQKEFGLVLDMEILSANAQVLTKQEAFETLTLTSRAEAKEMFVNLSITLSSFPEGAFTLKMTAHDLASDETSSFEIPFEVTP